MICRLLANFGRLFCAPNGTKLELFVGGFEEVGSIVFSIVSTENCRRLGFVVASCPY